MTTLAAVLLLDAIYVLMIGPAGAIDAAVGAVLAAALVRTLRPPRAGGEAAGARSPGRALVAIPGLAGVVAARIVLGTWQVARIVLGLDTASHAGIVDVPIEAATPAGVAVSAIAESLSPGSVLVDIDEARRVLRFHVLDTRDADAFRARLSTFYRRHQRFVVP